MPGRIISHAPNLQNISRETLEMLDEHFMVIRLTDPLEGHATPDTAAPSPPPAAWAHQRASLARQCAF
jgi:hypothetical protein